MRLDRLRINNFKNLIGVDIDFDESELATVLIGENGTGKSNVIEALVTIFRDLDLGDTTPFSYDLEYRCQGHSIEIDNRFQTNRLVIKIDGKRTTKATLRGGGVSFCQIMYLDTILVQVHDSNNSLTITSHVTIGG